MESKKASRVPAELIDLYNLYIHNEITRRDFVEGAKKFAIGGLTVAAIWEMLKPNYALGQVVPPADPRIKTEYATVPSPQGNGSIKGYLVRPVSAGAAKLPGILVVHENRGLNPHIEDIARRLALANFMTFAPDGLTSVGGYPGDDVKGGQLFGTVDRNKMFEDMAAAGNWLKARPDCTGKIGTTGFCFGGGIANRLTTRIPEVAAAVPFYGQPLPAADVANVKAAFLIHHGATDTGLVNSWPAFETALKANNVTYEVHIYPGAGHGFNNDSTPERYNEAASKAAMQRSIEWFEKYLRT